MQDNIESGFIFLDIAHPLVAWEELLSKVVYSTRRPFCLIVPQPVLRLQTSRY